MTLGPRVNDYDVLTDTRINEQGAKALAEAAEACWEAILKKDLVAFGNSFRESFEAQIAMFPNMVDQSIFNMIEEYRDIALGWKLSGAGGGGYLILISEKSVEKAIQVRVRRRTREL